MKLKDFLRILSAPTIKIAQLQIYLKKNNFSPRETAYIGDMFHDIEVGKKAKVITVAFSGGYNSREKLEKSNPDYLIDRLNKKELKKIIFN